MIGEINFPVDFSVPCAAMADYVRRAADLFAGAGSRRSGTASGRPSVSSGNTMRILSEVMQYRVRVRRGPFCIHLPGSSGSDGRN